MLNKLRPYNFNKIKISGRKLKNNIASLRERIRNTGDPETISRLELELQRKQIKYSIESIVTKNSREAAITHLQRVIKEGNLGAKWPFTGPTYREQSLRDFTAELCRDELNKL